MKTKVIEFVAHRDLRVAFEKKDEFALRTDRRLVWLQRACLYVLRKLGAYSMGESVTVERHLIDADTFMERLYKQQEEIFRTFNHRPKTLLIGAEDYADLMREVASSNTFAFRAEYSMRREILGLEIRVIPWMRGVLVMPE